MAPTPSRNNVRSNVRGVTRLGIIILIDFDIDLLIELEIDFRYRLGPMLATFWSPTQSSK